MPRTDSTNEDYLAIREHWDFSEEASKLRSVTSRFDSAVPSPTNVWSKNFEVAPAGSVNEEKKRRKVGIGSGATAGNGEESWLCRTFA